MDDAASGQVVLGCPAVAKDDHEKMRNTSC